MDHYFPRFFDEPSPALMAARLDYKFCRLKWCDSLAIDAIDAMIASEAMALKDEGDHTTSEELLRQALKNAVAGLTEEYHRHRRAKREWEQSGRNGDYTGEDPGSWWKKHIEPSLGCLRTVVQMLRCMPATSASAERFFKNAVLVESGRPNLSPETLAMEMRARHAIQKGRYNINDVCEAAKKLMMEQRPR